MIDRIKKVLASTNLDSIFLVNRHSEYEALALATHNAWRASAMHEHEDMHDAANALRLNGFDVGIAGLILIVRPALSLRFLRKELA